MSGWNKINGKKTDVIFLYYIIKVVNFQLVTV